MPAVEFQTRSSKVTSQAIFEKLINGQFLIRVGRVDLFVKRYAGMPVCYYADESNLMVLLFHILMLPSKIIPAMLKKVELLRIQIVKNYVIFECFFFKVPQEHLRLGL